jgi:hypothetical protein
MRSLPASAERGLPDTRARRVGSAGVGATRAHRGGRGHLYPGTRRLRRCCHRGSPGGSPPQDRSALLRSMVLGALNMEFRAGTPPAEVLNRINRLLCEKSLPEQFVTAFLFLLGPEGTGQFIGAGHEPTRVLPRRDGKSERLVSGQLMFGLFDFAAYETRTFQLSRGEKGLAGDRIWSKSGRAASRRWYYWLGCHSPPEGRKRRDPRSRATSNHQLAFAKRSQRIGIALSSDRVSAFRADSDRR